MKYIYNYTELFLNESFNSKEAKKRFVDTGSISKKEYTIIKKAFLPKYVYWGCREKASPENTDVILDSIYDITIWFEKSKQYLKSKDIYSYTYEEIRLLMNDPSIGPKKKKAVGQGDYEIIYEDKEGNIVVHVKDHNASVYWAHKYRKDDIVDGQWCTASYNYDTNFEEYSQNGPIFIYILPSLEKKYQRMCSVCANIGEGYHNPAEYHITHIKTGTTYYHESDANMDGLEFDDLEFYGSDDSSMGFDLGQKTLKRTANNSIKKIIKYLIEYKSSIKTSITSKSGNGFNKKDIERIHILSIDYIFSMNESRPEGPYLTLLYKHNKSKIHHIYPGNYSKFKDSKYLYKIVHNDGYIEVESFYSTTYNADKYDYFLELDDVDDIYSGGDNYYFSTDNIISYERCTYADVLEFYKPNTDPISHFDKSLVKKYNIKTTILSKAELLKLNITDHMLKYVIEVDVDKIKGKIVLNLMNNEDQFVVSDFKYMIRATNNYIKEIEKNKNSIKDLIKMGFVLDYYGSHQNDSPVPLSLYRTIDTNTTHKVMSSKYGLHFIINNESQNTENIKTLSDFVEYYKSQIF